MRFRRPPSVACPRASLRRRARHGFTLIEASLAIIIVGVGVLASAQLLAVGTAANADSHRMTTGLNLAGNVREWAQEKTADEIVALNGQSLSPAVDARNQPIAGLEDWAQVITVVRVNPGEVTTTGDSTSRLVRLTVNVQYRGKSVTDESWLIADTAD